MTLILELPDEQEIALKTRAQAHGVSAEQYAEQVLSRDLAQQSALGSVVESMRKLRARVKPDPEGWTTRDYVNYGRR
jgi:plasmid stability protein